MLVVGLTGGIGSGKTTVAQLFAELNVEIIDSDHIARDLVQPGEPALAELAKAFEEKIILDNGDLDRRLLRDIIFQDSNKKKIVEDILHPAIRAKIANKLQQTRLTKSVDYIMLVIPLLVDNGDWMMIDRILVVDCDDAIQVERVMQRDDQSREQVMAVMNAQISRKERMSAADDVINNNLSADKLEGEVLKLHKKYLSLSKTLA